MWDSVWHHPLRQIDASDRNADGIKEKGLGLCRFDAEQSSQFQAYLGLAQTQTQEAEEDGDDELRIERGNDLAPNRTCPLSQKEVSGAIE